LSTRPVDQTLAAVPDDAGARERRRRQVLAGGYRLRTASPAREGGPALTLVTMGPLVTEALEAADRWEAMDVAADVVVVTSPDLLFKAVQSRAGRATGTAAVLEQALPAGRARPMVTVLDGHPHALAFLAGVRQVPAVHLGVTEFGQSGDLPEVYRHHGLDADAIVAAGLDLLT
jgi:pyruvate dehydrogenase E1 component